MDTQKDSAIQNLIKEVNETIALTDDYINKAFPLIKELSEEFYKERDEDTWGQLGDLFEAVQWILETVSEIDSIKSLDTIISDYKA